MKYSGSSRVPPLVPSALALFFATTILLSCGKSPSDAKGPGKFDDPSVASKIPPQQTYSPGKDPGPPPAFVEMGDPRAKECIVRDVSSTIEGGSWRWTNVEPTLQFFLKDRDKQRFAMDFAINDATFKDTGPVTLSCFINGKLLTKVRCAKPGDYHLDQPVPSSSLEAISPVVVRAVLDKVWTAPADGTRLGYILVRAGFKNQ